MGQIVDTNESPRTCDRCGAVIEGAWYCTTQFEYGVLTKSEVLCSYDCGRAAEGEESR